MQVTGSRHRVEATGAAGGAPPGTPVRHAAAGRRGHAHRYVAIVLIAFTVFGVAGTADATTSGQWRSGVSLISRAQVKDFGTWRKSPVGIVGLFNDSDPYTQAGLPALTNATGDVDLAVGGIFANETWQQAAAGAYLRRWQATGDAIRRARTKGTIYIRFAHEMNGWWFPWRVTQTGDVAPWIASFRLFRSTVLARVGRSHPVKFVFAPNFGTSMFGPDRLWPGDQYVDVVGVSMYEWQLHDTKAKWADFLVSRIGPDYWSGFAARHRKPLALSEWGGRSPTFLAGMRTWMAQHAGTGPGRLLYDVYFNGDAFTLYPKPAAATGDPEKISPATPAAVAQYRSLRWGRR